MGGVLAMSTVPPPVGSPAARGQQGVVGGVALVWGGSRKQQQGAHDGALGVGEGHRRLEREQVVVPRVVEVHRAPHPAPLHHVLPPLPSLPAAPAAESARAFVSEPEIPSKNGIF